MGKIRVAELITRLDWGGSPDIVRLICNSLDKNLYNITLITGKTKYPSAKTKEFLEKFSQKIIIIPELKRNINPVSDLAALIRLYLIFRRQKFDIVHTHTAKAGTLGRIAAFLSSNPIIIHTPHGHNFYGYFGPVLTKLIIIIERFVSRFTDKIIALTELEKKDLIYFKVAETEKIQVIYTGLELDSRGRINIDKVKMRRGFNIEANENVVGMVVRLEPIKGPEYFVEAAKIVLKKFPQTKFILVGEGSLRRGLEEQVKKMDFQNRFIFTGWREDIAEILSILDILVLPSLNEAVGMILIEAQAHGVPVIATNVGGIPEIVRDNQTGILVPPADSDGLARAIKNLLTDAQQRLAMAQAAIKWTQDKFKAQDMVNEISRLYQELISSEK